VFVRASRDRAFCTPYRLEGNRRWLAYGYKSQPAADGPGLAATRAAVRPLPWRQPRITRRGSRGGAPMRINFRRFLKFM